MSRNYFYEIEEDWSLVPRTAWLPSGGVWDAVDYGDFAVFTNGSVVVLRTPGTDDFHFAPEEEFPHCASLCDLNGQLVIGDTAMGSNWVQWSRIGAATFDIGRSNDAGYRHMPWDGPVLRVKTLGKKALVYGENGIGSLEPSNPRYIQGAVMGFEHVAPYGIASRGAVGGDEKEHVFIDEGGFLRKVTQQGIELLGYREFFQPLIGSEVNIVKDPLYEDYYISNGETSFLLSGNELTQLPYAPSGLALFDGTLVGPTTGGSSLFRTLTSNVFDLGVRSGKTITQVAFGGGNWRTTQCAVDWRDNSSDAFRRTPWFPLNEKGQMCNAVEGTEFRIALRFSTEDEVELGDDVFVNWKLTDKRGIRGAYVPTAGNA